MDVLEEQEIVDKGVQLQRTHCKERKRSCPRKAISLGSLAKKKPRQMMMMHPMLDSLKFK